MQLRLQKQAGSHPALILGQPRKEVQAALDQVIIAKAHVIGQGLQAQIPDPKPAVPLRPVLEDKLHAVLHGLERNLIHAEQGRVSGGKGRYCRRVCRGHAHAAHIS